MLGFNQEPSRKIVISTEIDNRVAGEVIAQIMDVNDYDAVILADSKSYEPRPIELFINSGGGSATDGFAIIGAMEMSETPIVTYGMGIVASMALAIFVAGDIRIAHRYTRFMYHSVAYGTGGYIKDHEDSLVESDMIQRMYNDMFEGTGITPEKMAVIRREKSNFFFSGKESVEIGVADEVFLKPDKKVMTQEEFDRMQAEVEKLMLEQSEQTE